MSMCSSSSIASWILSLANSLISAIGAASGFSGPSTSSSVSRDDAEELVEVADDVRRAEHRDQMIVDVVLGLVADDVERADAVLAVASAAASSRRPVRCGRCGPARARWLRGSNSALVRGQAEVAPVLQAVLDVVDPVLEVGLDQVVDRQVGREVARVEPDAEEVGLAAVVVDRRGLGAAHGLDLQRLGALVAVRVQQRAVVVLRVPGVARLGDLELGLHVEEEVDQRAAAGADRQRVVRVDEGLVDEALRAPRTAMCGVASSDTCGLPSSLTSPATGPRSLLPS